MLTEYLLHPTQLGGVLDVESLLGLYAELRLFGVQPAQAIIRPRL